MHDYDPDDLDAGEWLANVLLAGMNKQSTSAYAAKAYLQAMQVLVPWVPPLEFRSS